MKEKIVQTKQCKKCNSNFDITDKDLEFYDKVIPIFNSKKCQIPTPTLCPDCRQQRRLVWRNERRLYRRKCNATGEDIISIYSPDKLYKVYNSDFWWSDKWEGLDYGINIDFNIGFCEYFNDLLLKVPHISNISIKNENSPFINFVGDSKYIYMSGDVLDSQNLYYSNMMKKSAYCCDCFDLISCEKCYECIYSQRLFNCSYANLSADCRDSSYLYRCYNLSNCLFCTELKNKSYYIFNIEYSKKDYLTFKKEFDKADIKKYNDIILKLPKQACHLTNIENTTGDLLKNCKNSNTCFQSIGINDCKYVTVGYNMNNCMDTTIHNPECFLDYEAISGGKLKNSISNICCWDSNNLYYNYNCFNSLNLFGCVGLKNKQYCILNKQYSKEEYNKLVPKIIEKMKADGEWGEFFPANMSPFGYNETVAQEYFPLKKEEAIKNNFNWSDYESPAPNVEKIIPANKLPDNISDIPDDILNWAIECEITKKPFRIINQELEFYRKHNLPIPKRHPDQRHLDRMKLRNPRKLFNRDCDKCGESMKTTYSPDREEIVYCEKCYNEEVY